MLELILMAYVASSAAKEESRQRTPPPASNLPDATRAGLRGPARVPSHFPRLQAMRIRRLSWDRKPFDWPCAKSKSTSTSTRNSMRSC